MKLDFELREDAAKSAISIIDGNGPVLDNDYDVMQRFRVTFDDSTRGAIANCEICKLIKGQCRLWVAKSDFKLFTRFGSERPI